MNDTVNHVKVQNNYRNRIVRTIAKSFYEFCHFTILKINFFDFQELKIIKVEAFNNFCPMKIKI